jgi:hypothetical protein
MIFTLLYKKYPDGRAEDTVRMKDYEDAGTVEAYSKSLAVVAIHSATTHGPTTGVSLDTHIRRITVGDILVDEDDVAWIYTPVFQWAQVTVTKKSPKSRNEDDE